LTSAQGLVFSGGTIITADPAQPRASVLATDGDRITYVGNDAAAVEGQHVDLGGGTLVPGFRDGHIHPLWGGTETLDAPVAQATDRDDVVRRVAQHAAEHPERAWVVGHGYPCEALPNAMGRAEWLDEVVADRPVALWASDHHTMWVNSAALAAAGIDEHTPDPPAGRIVRDEDGRATGALLEGAMSLIEPLVPRRGRADKEQGLRVALRAMAQAGIVWAQEAALAPEDVGVYLDVARAGELTAGVNIALRVDPAGWRDQREVFAETRAAVQRAMAELDGDGVPGGRVSVRTVKIFADGVIESGTGALLEPYTDAPHSCGIPNWEAAELAEAVAAFDTDGFQAHIHAIGDLAVRISLDALETAAQRNGVRDRRPVLAHTQLVHPVDLKRFATQGVVANFEPLWAQRSLVMTELTEPRLGEERSAWQYPIDTLLGMGAPVSFGSDWPVSSMVPMEGIEVAVNRQTPEGEPPGGWLPHERISLDEALAAYTSGTAYQAFDDGAGTLRVGARADLALVGGDIAALPPSELAHAPVLGTWLNAVEVHRT
jgi:predicted amidohydrolase YtcJ